MLLQFLFVNVIPIAFCQFYFGLPQGNSLFPKITFKAYKPQGLEVSIKKLTTIEALIKFEYNKNNGSWRTANMENSLLEWIFFDPKMQLKVGDFVNYTITIISNQFDPSRLFIDNPDNRLNLGINFGTQRYTYTDTQIWNVTDLESLCEANHLPMVSRQNCSDGVPIFEDDFAGATLNRQFWTVEQYIPQYSEDNYEFVSYQDVDDCIFLSDSKLHLKPMVLEESQHLGTLDLRNRCSRNITQACLYRQIGANYLPPVKSGKIVSNFAFKYGKVEIRAKLPLGDWIYPQVELIPMELTKKYPKFVIAYSRGNKELKTKEGVDVGANILYGGHVASTEEMRQIYHLKNIKLSGSLRDDMNVYTLTWTPDKIILAVNGDVYSTTYQPVNDGNYRIALGVGVGGNVDFPDDVVSGSYTKPWKNDAAKQVKNFVDAKRVWTKSWRENSVALQIDYVRVFEV